MPTLRTLCSGGELFGLGACHAGWTHVDGYEINDRIASVARRNNLNVRTADICKVDFESLVPVDHTHVSPSCKNASQASQGVETSEDLALADAIGRAIQAHQGRSFSLENVWGYRHFKSLKTIRDALDRAGFAHEYRHLNSADYGVPQTRKRLILLAVRRDWRSRPRWPMQTHRRGGGLGVERWVGWLTSIADLVDSLPATEPAPWQLARLPAELRATMLFHYGISQDHHGNKYQQNGRESSEPAYTITSNGNQVGMRAYIVGGGNTQFAQVDSKARSEDEPMFTVSASDGSKKVAAAFLVDSKNSGQEWARGFRDADEPAYTCTTDHKDSHQPRAFLVGGQYARNNDDPDRRVQTALAASPSWTVTPRSSKDTRAYLAGRWVRMTVQALGRFQSVPDSYRGLTSEINGNGVPVLLARRIMESLLCQ